MIIKRRKIFFNAQCVGRRDSDILILSSTLWPMIKMIGGKTARHEYCAGVAEDSVGLGLVVVGVGIGQG